MEKQEGIVSDAAEDLRMSAKKIIPIGTVFGRLTVIEIGPSNKAGNTTSICRCSCGKIITTINIKLRFGQQSCGCLTLEEAIKSRKTHGRAGTPIYILWCGMINRCSNTKQANYQYYGGRGIKVCERWMKFENFFADMGEKPAGLSLERKNNNGDYCPGNCVWATRKQQNRNSRKNRFYVVDDIRACVAEHCERLKLHYGMVNHRLNRGWSVELAFS